MYYVTLFSLLVKGAVILLIFGHLDLLCLLA